MDDLTKQLEALYISSHKINDDLNVELDIDDLVNNLNNLHIEEYVGDDEVDELIENINSLHISPECKIKDAYDVQIEKTNNGQAKIKIIPKCVIEFMRENPFMNSSMPRYIDAF